MYKTIIISILSMILLINTNYSQNNYSSIEITKTDITEYTSIKSNQICVFDIQLGMTQETVNDVLRQNKNLLYYVDELHGTDDFRIYVYDKDKNNKENNCILYLIWTNNSNKLTRITFFEEFSTYLKGNSTKLLTFEAFAGNSKIIQDYLGLPDKTEVTLDIPAKQLKQSIHYYDNKGIQIFLKESGTRKSLVFSLYKTE